MIRVVSHIIYVSHMKYAQMQLLKIICAYSITFLKNKIWVTLTVSLKQLLINHIRKVFNITFMENMVEPKNLAIPAHFISSPRPMPRRKKCPRTNEEGPNC